MFRYLSLYLYLDRLLLLLCFIFTLISSSQFVVVVVSFRNTCGIPKVCLLDIVYRAYLEYQYLSYLCVYIYIERVIYV